MRKLLTALFAFALISSLSACMGETHEIKSPCVGVEGSPCDRRSPTLNQA